MFLHLLVGVADGAQPLHASDLQVGEVGGVVDVALRVDFGVPDPDFGRVEQLLPNLGVRVSHKAFMPSRACAVAESKANCAASDSRPLIRSTSSARFVAAMAYVTETGPFAEVAIAI